MFFETYFDLWSESATGVEEAPVCCPFPHTKADGSTYYEQHPSCYINLNKRVWHCKSCGASGNELQMVRQVLGCTQPRARKFLNMLQQGWDKSTITSQLEESPLTDDKLLAAANIGIYSTNVVKDLNIKIDKIEDRYEYSFPVYYKSRVVDVRTYRPGMKPKVLSLEGAPAGLIIPFDIWQASDKHRWTLLMAGEKDMACARSVGFNAITLTGGETSSPLSCEWFKDRSVAICYDNDDAGRMGARKIAKEIAPYCSRVRIVTKFHEDFPGTDTKEDFTDWVLKYEGTYDRFIEYIKETPDFEYEDTAADDEYPLVTIGEAINPDMHGRVLRSTVQILTTSDTPYEVPIAAKLKKLTSDKGRMTKGQELEWALEDDSSSLFTLIGVGKDRIDAAIKSCLHMGKEQGCVVDVRERGIVWVCQIADASASYENMTELTAYCIGVKPIQGKKYTLRYLRTTDTVHGCVAMIVDQMEDAVDDISTFAINESTKESLVYAQHIEGNVAERISHRAQAVRGLLGYECNEDLITALDLTYNSVEAFDYGNNKNVKGYMDSLIIGESRVGKSDTAKHLRDAYNLGAFVSLAGSSATLAGIVGGSVKDPMGRQSTRAGVIPRNHKSLIIFEELAKSQEAITRSLTDVRSSGLARITRVSGSIEMPASLRMITLSNVRALSNGETRPIAEYANGIDITKELIGTAEDIARYDMIFILGDTGEDSDPLYDPPEPYPIHVLQDLIRWTWSRKAENIKFIEDADKLIRDASRELNNTYPLHIKLFGTECWKKLARLSIAAACYTVSTDASYENVMVTPEHVQWAKDFLVKIYDNNTFKLHSVVQSYQSRSQLVERDTEKLQGYYIKHKEALDKLYQYSKMDKKTFKELAEMEDKDFAPMIRTLIARDFVQSDREMMYTTIKFKRTYELLNRQTEVPTV